MKRKPIIILSIAILFTLLTAAHAYSYDLEEEQPNQEIKQMIVFNQGIEKKDLIDFVKKYELKVQSVTFQGDGFSCGGTIKSIDEIDSLINTLVEDWKDSLTQDQIPYENKVKIREHIKLAEDDLFKAVSVSIEVTNGITEGLEKDRLVKEIHTYMPASAIAAENQVVFTIGSPAYTVNGQVYDMPAAPFIENDRTFVPVRFLALSLGVAKENIQWFPESQQVFLSKGDTTIGLNIGSQFLNVNDDITATLMDVAPVIRDEYTFLPARYVAEAFGYQVGWDQNTLSVLVGPPDGPEKDTQYTMTTGYYAEDNKIKLNEQVKYAAIQIKPFQNGFKIAILHKFENKDEVNDFVSLANEKINKLLSENNFAQPFIATITLNKALPLEEFGDFVQKYDLDICDYKMRVLEKDGTRVTINIDNSVTDQNIIMDTVGEDILLGVIAFTCNINENNYNKILEIKNDNYVHVVDVDSYFVGKDAREQSGKEIVKVTANDIYWYLEDYNLTK